LNIDAISSGVKPGPKKDRPRLSTRLACLLARIGKCAPGRIVRIPLGELAETLECKRETLRKLTMRLRERAWFFQGYHTVVFLTHETTPAAPRGFWVLHTVNRHSLHRIWAAPGKWRRLRWHQRKGDVAAWDWFLQRIKKWALAMIFRKINRSQSKHKGFSPGIWARAAGARAPGPVNRAAYRRYGKLAAYLDEKFASVPAAPSVKIIGWCVNRLEEQHGKEAILQSLKHAASLLKKRRQTPLDNPASWICGVAKRHLDRDGFVPSQRRRAREGSGLTPAAQKVEGRREPLEVEGAIREITIDGKTERWQHRKGANIWEKL
jgi:hypothetical protein